MWMWTPPSSTIRRASAAYSSGVYGIAGHCSRLARAPEMAQVMTTGSSRLTLAPRWEVGRATSHSYASDTRSQPREAAGMSLRMIGSLIAAVVIGLIAGGLARALMPGRDPMGLAMTALLGIVGAVIGFFLFRAIGIGDSDKFDL